MTDAAPVGGRRVRGPLTDGGDRADQRGRPACSSRRRRAASSRVASAADCPAHSDRGRRRPARPASARKTPVSQFCAGNGAMMPRRLDRAHRAVRDAAGQPPAHRPRQHGAGVGGRGDRPPVRLGRRGLAGAQEGGADLTTPDAPSANAAATPRRSAIPPAASTGTATASTTCGTSENVPTSECSARRRNETR